MPIILSALFSRAGLIGMAVAAVVGVILIQTARLGHANHKLAVFKAEAAAQKANTAKVEAGSVVITASASAKNTAAQAQIQSATRAALKRIPAHVAPTDPHFYPWPLWSVRVYNASLGLPDIPDPSSGPDDASSGLGAADAAQVFIANNGACRADQERLSGLQGWVRAQASNQK